MKRRSFSGAFAGLFAAPFAGVSIEPPHYRREKRVRGRFRRGSCDREI
jgi:hypothetical protein